MPFTRRALKQVHPGIFEAKARPCNKVTKRLGDQYFPRCSKTSDTRAGMHRYTSEIVRNS
jgi:hypothetical protein